MSDRTAVLKKCLKEILMPELVQHSYNYDGKYTFRHIDNKKQTVKLIEFQPGIKSATGQFTVNLAIYSLLYNIHSPIQTLEDVHSGYCFIRDRLGCVRKPGRFWSIIFGVSDKWWKQILYGPRDIWWNFSENRQITESSVNECRQLIEDVGLAWLEKNGDVDVIKKSYDTIKARART